MAYGSALVDNIQSSTANTPVVFKDGNGTQIGTLCRAWVNFNGTNGTIRGSFNVSSITLVATGIYTANFTNALPDTNDAVPVCGSYDGFATSASYGIGIAAFATGSVTVATRTEVLAYANFTYVTLSVLR